MEPMALGSPVGSPSGTPSSPTTSPFLPSFLMGEATQNVSTPRSNSQTAKHVTFSTGGLTMPSSQLNTLLPQIGNSRSLQSVTSPVAEKSSSDCGPPTLGLFDTLSPLPGTAVSSLNNNDSYLSHSGMLAGMISPGHPTGIASPGAETVLFGSSGGEGPKETYCGAGSEELSLRGSGVREDTWVTVFGFLPHARNDVLVHFVHCGTILEYRWGGAQGSEEEGCPASRCNWVHVRFRTAREARRALSRNGKVFGGCMMVGVIPCQDVDILQSQKENIQGPEVSFPSQKGRSPARAGGGALSGIRPLGVAASPWKESPKARSSIGGSSEFVEIRPLVRTASSPQNELQSSGSTKNSGLISKTIDFLFGQ